MNLMKIPKKVTVKELIKNNYLKWIINILRLYVNLILTLILRFCA